MKIVRFVIFAIFVVTLLRLIYATVISSLKKTESDKRRPVAK